MRMEKTLPFFIALYFLASFPSISASQIVLGAALVIWAVHHIRHRKIPAFPPFFWALIGYAALSLLASAFSDNPAVSFKDSRELLIFLVIPIVYVGITRAEDLKRIGWAFLASALLSILFSLAYFLWKAAPGERISGFMDHYMTQAGLLLLFSAVALSQSLFTREKSRWIWGGGFLLASVALVMTLTRNAWVGVFVVIAVLLGLFKPKALVLIPVAAALFFLASPQPVKRRALSIFDPQSYSNAQRIEYLQAGFKIIKDYPLLGTGPNTVHVIFQQPRYGLSEVARNNVHLHNNILQIAAERGIPTLLVWLGFMTWVFLALLRMAREKQDPLLFVYAAAALSALAGLFAAGFFEYNWGDSEVVTLFLGLITLPFGLERSLQARAEE